MDIEEKVIAYKELTTKIAQLEEQKKLLSQEILTLMPKETKSLRFQNLQVKKYSRLNIKTSLETAKTFGASKMEEVVDKDRLKELLFQGVFIPDISEISYVVVSKISNSP